MVSYVRGPVYKSIKKLGPVDPQALRAYLPNLALWGGAAGAGVAVFTSGVPIFKETFYSKIPIFGSYFTYNPDPEDVPV